MIVLFPQDDKPDAKEKTKGGKGKEAEKTQPGKKDGTKGGKGRSVILIFIKAKKGIYMKL